MNNKIKLMIISLIVSSIVIGANSNKKVNTNVSASQKDIQNNGKDSEKKPQQMGGPMKKTVITEDMIVNKTADGYDLNFDVNKNYTTKTATVNGKTITYRAYENIVYVAKPVDIAYQTINIIFLKNILKIRLLENIIRKLHQYFSQIQLEDICLEQLECLEMEEMESLMLH